MRRIIRKFAQNNQTHKQTNKQTEISNTEAALIPCGSPGGAGQYLPCSLLLLTSYPFYIPSCLHTPISPYFPHNSISLLIYISIYLSSPYLHILLINPYFLNLYITRNFHVSTFEFSFCPSLYIFYFHMFLSLILC